MTTGTEAPATPIAEALASWIEGFSLDGEPQRDRLLLKARMQILDALGIALGASTLDDGFPDLAHGVVDDFGSRTAAQLIGSERRAAPALAAFYNGALMHGCESDDTWMARAIHTEASVVPAALAVGEDLDVDGLALAEAFCLGAEAEIRLVAATDPVMGLLELGFHNSSLFGAYGAAAVTGRLHGLDAERLADALSLCTSFASGTTSGWGQRTGRAKCLQPGWSAFAGITAANLVRGGLMCAHTTIEGTSGLYESHVGDAGWDAARVTADLGTTWHFLDTTFKLHPGGVMLQAALDVTQQLMREHGIGAGDVEEIEVLVPNQYQGLMERTKFFATDFELTDGYALTHSWPYSIACTLIHGQVGLQHLRADVVSDPRLRDLVGRTRFVLDDAAGREPEEQPTEVRLRTASGWVSAARAHHLGYADTATLERIVEKFEANARLRLSAERVERLRDLVIDIESTSAREIAAAAAGG